MIFKDFNRNELFIASKVWSNNLSKDKLINSLKYSLKRLKWKFEYTNVAFSMLPEKFTISQLQKIYEIVFNKKFDKRNFRKKLILLEIVKETKEKITDVSHRPPKLYKLNKEVGEIVEII